MRLRSSLLVLATVAAALVPAAAKADAIPYPNQGTVAPEVATFATGSGINVYFYGSTAGDTDYVRVYDVQTGYNSGNILNNKTSEPGSYVAVGTGAGQINAGDQLIFYIYDNYTRALFASAAAYSSDGVNHAYVTAFSGSSTIPAGLFVGLEDTRYGAADLNYNDDTFVFTGVAAPAVGVNAVAAAATPEPNSLALLGTGVLGLAGMVRRRFLGA